MRKLSCRSPVAASFIIALAAGTLLLDPIPRHSLAQDAVEASSSSEASGHVGDRTRGDASERPQTWQTPEGPKPAWLRLGEEQPDVYTEDYLAFRRRLREPIAVAYDNMPLRKVLKDLSTRLEITILLDEVGIAAGVAGPDDPVTIGPIEVSLGKSLDLILDPLELCYEWDEAAIVITTSEEGAYNDTRYYDLSYVLPGEAPTVELIELIASYVPGDWDTGEDEAVVFGSLLVVRCPERAHQRIEALLARVSRMPRGHFNREWKAVADQPMAGGGGTFCGGGEEGEAADGAGAVPAE